MAKIIKKKFFEVEIPMINEKFEVIGGSINELDNKVIKIDVTRKLKGKGVDLIFKIVVKDGKAVAIPKKLTLLPFFISHMMHKGTSYVEDSITTETKDHIVDIKPFFITRKKVSRAVRRTLRNSAKNWIVDYLKTKSASEIFDEILSNQLQKPLSMKLKRTYPLAICEIRIFEIKKSLGRKEEPSIGQIEVKSEEKESEGMKEDKVTVEEEIEKQEKPKKKSKKEDK